MGLVIDAAKSVVDAVVDTVETIVDVVVDVVETVADLAASLLGYEDQVIENFSVHNQPLFEEAYDDNPLQLIIYESIMGSKDIPANILQHSQWNAKTSLRRFVKYIEQDKYFQRFPKVESSILYAHKGEITEVLNGIEGVPCTIDYAKVGTLYANYWIQYWLFTNKDYNLADHSITHDGSIWYVSPKVFNYISANNSYEIPVTQGVLEDVLDYQVPSRPTGLHYIAYYHLDSAPTNLKIFIYAVDEGTYPTLDDPSIPLGTDNNEISNTLRLLPAIPLRVNNTNFNSTQDDKYQKTSDTVAQLNLDADAIIDAVMSDPSVVGNEDKLDHVYINFGVKMWDTSQIAMRYMFTLLANMYPNQAVSEGLYNSSTDVEKPYNTIKVTSDDYSFVFRYAYITHKFTSKAWLDVHTNSTEYQIYYSDLSKFRDGELVHSYYSSEGKALYNIGYQASSVEEVDLFLAGNGILAPGETSTEAQNYLQVTQKIIYNEEILKPDLAYKNSGGTLVQVDRLADETTVGQEFAYYNVIPSGVITYTIQAPFALLRVIDAQTGRFKMVKFNIANKDDLVVPLIYELVRRMPNTQTTQLLLASSYVSIYTAHYEVIEVSFFQKLLAVVQIVLIIYGLQTFTTNMASMTTSQFINYAVKKIAIQMVINYVVEKVAEEISPELAIVIGVVLTNQYGSQSDIEFANMEFVDLAEYLADIADIIAIAINVHTDTEMTALKSASKRAILDQQRADDALKEITEGIGVGAGVDALSLLSEGHRTIINPMSPEAYLAHWNESNKALLELDHEARFNNFFNPMPVGL